MKLTLDVPFRNSNLTTDCQCRRHNAKDWWHIRFSIAYSYYMVYLIPQCPVKRYFTVYAATVALNWSSIPVPSSTACSYLNIVRVKNKEMSAKNKPCDTNTGKLKVKSTTYGVHTRALSSSSTYCKLTILLFVTRMPQPLLSGDAHISVN